MNAFINYYQNITEDEIFEGLLGYGLFAEKLPPIFTSKLFFDYVFKMDPGFPKSGYDYIKYENIRNINVPRLLAIPHPFAYFNLVSEIKINWEKIKNHFSDKTRGHSYKISKVHLKKMKHSKRLFKMNYKIYSDDINQNIDLVLGKRYLVNADISNCFPSIYSHSLPWALIGKEKAKSNEGKPKQWQNKLDTFLRNTKSKETNGILIGPHSSNLISEIILVTIDNELKCKGYEFIRYIDDYTCYTRGKDEAEMFLVDLSFELKKYDLALNHKKSKISELPHASVSKWVRKLRHHRFKYYTSKNNENFLSVKEVEIFLDNAIDLMHNEQDNSAILNYALKILSKKRLDVYSKKYLVKRVHHLTYLYPYLIQIIDESVFEPFKVSKNEIKTISNSMFNLGTDKKLFEVCSYSLFFAIKYDFKISSRIIGRESLRSADCIFMTLAYLYSKKHCLTTLNYCAKALSLKKKDFDKYWLFVYEVLPKIYFSGPFKSMKKNKISFIKQEFDN